MLRIPHCLDNPLIDSGKVVSPKHRQRSTSQKHHFLLLVLNSVKRLSIPQGTVRPEGLDILKYSLTSSDLESAAFRLEAKSRNRQKCTSLYDLQVEPLRMQALEGSHCLLSIPAFLEQLTHPAQPSASLRQKPSRIRVPQTRVTHEAKTGHC
jgi:hypothetical protein